MRGGSGRRPSGRLHAPARFEALCRPLLLRLVAPMREAAQMAGIELDESQMGTLVKGNLENKDPAAQQWQKQVRTARSFGDALFSSTDMVIRMYSNRSRSVVHHGRRDATEFGF